MNAFEIVGKACAIIFTLCLLPIFLAFGLGWVSVAAWPIIVIGVPIAICIFVLVKIVKA